MMTKISFIVPEQFHQLIMTALCEGLSH